MNPSAGVHPIARIEGDWLTSLDRGRKMRPTLQQHRKGGDRITAAAIRLGAIGL